MQAQTPPLPPENEEIAAELRYLHSIDDPQHTHHPDDIATGNLPTDTECAQGGDDDPATMTVREYLEGEDERPVYLHTHCGTLQVTGVHFFSDGPWLETGRGFNRASWCVSFDRRLYFGKAEAERSAS